jgi:4-aminobutyrate aminotransferase/(S)-3-amino-2-methylpropionate transaminase
MEENNACGLAREIEAVMVPRLKAIQENFPQIGDVRGRGAMLAIELVEPGTTNPNAALASTLNQYCHRNGVVTLTTGTYGNVFRFLPSLASPLPLIEEALTILEAGFEASI